MVYTPTAWVDNSSPDINATNLNKMETGIDEAHDHIDDTSAAHAASAVSFSPTGTVAATDVQAAIAEVASEAGGGTSPPFSDATALVKDNTDATKLVRVEAGTVATGTTRVLTMPNADVDLGLQTPNTRTISTTAPLTGGGDLSANRTLAISAASDTATGAVELATNAETTTGTDTARATTPANVKAALDARLSSVRDWAFSGTLTTTTGVMRVPIHQAGTITSIRAMVNTAPTGASIIIDVNKNGTTMYTTQGNRPTIAISGNAVSATLPDVTSVAAGDYLTVDIDQIGSTIQGANLVVSVRYSY